MDRGNEENAPFFITLIMNDYLLHNCMLDSGASSSVMTKRVMEQFNLRISRPYHNICAMDNKLVEVHGLIKDLQVHLAVFPDIQIILDIVVIDVPDAWGKLLSRKWAIDLGGSIQKNFSYATIPSLYGSMVRLNREIERKYHVGDPNNPSNELKYKSEEIGNYVVFSNFLGPLEEKVKEEKLCEIWHMHFDGSYSRSGKGVGIVIKSPSAQEFTFAYRLKFDATNNVAEYEALLLGLEICKDMGVKLLSIKGDSDLVVSQVKNKFACWSVRLRRYRKG